MELFNINILEGSFTKSRVSQSSIHILLSFFFFFFGCSMVAKYVVVHLHMVHQNHRLWDYVGKKSYLPEWLVTLSSPLIMK